MTRSSAPLIGFWVNITPALSGARSDWITTPMLGRVNSPTRLRYVIAESELADHQTSRSAASTSSAVANVQQREVLTRETGVGAVFVGGRGSHGEGVQAGHERAA